MAQIELSTLVGLTQSYIAKNYAAALIDTDHAAVGKAHQRKRVGIDIVPHIHALFEDGIVLCVLIAHRGYLGYVGARGGKNHGDRMRGIIKGWDADGRKLCLMMRGEMRDIVVVLRLGIHEFTHIAACERALTIEGAGVIYAGFTHHIGEMRFFDKADDLFAMGNLRCHRNRTVYVLTRLQGANGDRAVRVSRRENCDGVDILHKQLIQGGKMRNAEFLARCLSLLGICICHDNALYKRMLHEKIHEALRKLTASEDADLKLLTHFYITFAFIY